MPARGNQQNGRLSKCRIGLNPVTHNFPLPMTNRRQIPIEVTVSDGLLVAVEEIAAHSLTVPSGAQMAWCELVDSQVGTPVEISRALDDNLLELL